MSSVPSSSNAHSVVEPGVATKRIAGTVVILYALVALVPLVWDRADGLQDALRRDQLPAEDPVRALA